MTERPLFTSDAGGRHTACDDCGGLYLYLWVTPTGHVRCGRCQWTRPAPADTVTDSPTERPAR